MAELTSCINQALSAGRISKQVAQAIEQSSDPLEAIETMALTAKRAKREAMFQAVRIAQAWDRASTHPEGAATGLMSLLVKDVTGKAGYANIDMRQKFYEHKYHALLADFLNKFRTTAFGMNQDREGLNNLVRILYGEPTDDPQMKAIAEAYQTVIEEARKDFNRMGGSIPKNDRYLMPQNHDAVTVRKHGKDQWLTDVRQWIDPEQMTDDFGRRMSPEELDEGLDYAFETITTNGLNKAKDFTAPVHLGKKMARRGSEKRFLYFKDAESWLAYQNKYGRGDVFQTLIGDLNMKANDIATMEIMGTNPRAAFDTLLQMVEKDAVAKGKPLPGYRKSALQAVFKTAAGQIEQGNMTTLRDTFQTTRNVITASRLGRAVLSAISDEGFTSITASYNNLPITGVWGKKARLLTGDDELRITATRIGLGAEAWTNTVAAGNRFGDVYMTGRTGKAAEWVMRASGLVALTDAGRKAFTLEFSGALADAFGKSYDEAQDQFGRAFKAYGITEADWDTFRATPTFEQGGARYADMTQEGGLKFHQMIMSEVDYAVPTPDARVRAVTTGGLAAETIPGQIVRTLMNLKSFPITLITTHFYRAFYQSTYGEKAAYFGTMLAATTVMGAIAMQAKDVTAGREPRPMDSAAAWGAAIAQGGGLGIFGDYLFSDQNRFGQSWVQTAFGPTGQIATDATALTLGNVQQLFKGEDTNFSVEALRFIESNTPSIWQIQPLSNAMFDQMELMLDPKAAKRFAQARRKRMRDYEQGYWWGPGEAIPDLD